MKALIQRVKSASVTVENKKIAEIDEGLFILLGVQKGDTDNDMKTLAAKTSSLRIFCDENDKMNRSVLNIGGSALVVSQFTLCADTKKGNRPSFTNAMPPEEAERLYKAFCLELSQLGVASVQHGSFGADMLCSIQNDGPVTIMLDTDTWRKPQ